MSLRWQTIGIDSPDPGRLARWWAELLGWRITYEDDEEVVVEPPAGSPEAGLVPDLGFFKVDDPKVVKNRLHLDLRPDDRDAEVARAEALGATRVDIGQGEQTWVVLADPEGNEFCILRAFTPEEVAG
jgi:predicted enzyme related to lactoylglutathione lyase